MTKWALKREPHFFLVKHDLASFQAFPGRIWQTGRGRANQPLSHRQVHPGDRWIAYAYESVEGRQDSASLVQGFFRCVKGSEYSVLPRSSELDAVGYSGGHAWVVEGQEDGRQPRSPVLIPPISKFLDKRLFSRSSVIPLSRGDYWKVSDYASNHDEPFETAGAFGSTPRTEQELLLVFAETCDKFGVSKIARVRTRFPDLMVELGSADLAIHVELELFSHGFVAHRHKTQVRARRFEKKPVCVVCWVDDDSTVRRTLPVFELRDLISGRETLRDLLHN